jgi:hypothetical protein
LGIFIVVMLTLVVGSTAAFAQTLSAPPAKVLPTLNQADAKQRAHVAAVSDCEKMWDRGTHMSTQQWSRACRRVQNRLKLLD